MKKTNTIELYYPLDKIYITQKFGQNFNTFYKDRGMLGHSGIDYGDFGGLWVRAAHSGVVIYAGGDVVEGIGVVVWDKSKTFKTIYWHGKENSLRVNVGDKVRTGQVLMTVGNTGRSTGPHLHFGLKKTSVNAHDGVETPINIYQNNGYFGATDPEPYLNGKYAKEIANIDAMVLLSLLKNLTNPLKAIKKWRELFYK